MKSSAFYKAVMLAIHHDIAECYLHNVTPKEIRIEQKILSARMNKEGLVFCTKTLPRLCKAVDTALATGTPFSILGFKKAPNSQLPRFLGWLLRELFDSDGVELANANPMALKHLRQLCYILYKLEVPSSEASVTNVIENFLETDKLLVLTPEQLDDQVIVEARKLITRIFCNLDPHDVIPRHGPGSVSTGEAKPDKSWFSRLYSALEKEYPFTEYFHYNMSHTVDRLPEVQGLIESDTPTAKVVLVPKDSRGPRLISCEPLEIQWIQGGLGPRLEEAIRLSRISSGFVNFNDQTINGNLALLGSKGYPWVSLDMKDASDRVSLDLVKSLFGQVPRLLSCLLATRSTHTRLPDGRIIELNKFAPMGSRLCFPVEAIVFYCLILGTLRVRTGMPIKKLIGRVYVYGDDIIMHSKDYHYALQQLPKYGLMFNNSKCCVAGSFRESCGVDAYKGVNVTPSRMRAQWSTLKNPETYTSYISFRNAMAGMYLFRVASLIETQLQSVYGPIPYTGNYRVAPNGALVAEAGGPAFADAVIVVPENPSCGVAKPSNSLFPRKRFNRRYQRIEVFGYVSEAQDTPATQPGWEELLRSYYSLQGRSSNEPVTTSGGFYALPRRNRLKRGWFSA